MNLGGHYFMMGNIHLESDNLIIRSSVFDDCQYFDEWERKDYIREFFTMEVTRDYEEIVREFVLNEVDNTKFQMTIIFKETCEPIGRIYITGYDENLKSLDITRIYIGEEEYLGKGYGKESMILLLGFIFEDLEIERASLDTFEGHEKGVRLFGDLGFVEEGVMRHSTRKHGRFYDLYLKSMLSHEYFELYGKK